MPVLICTFFILSAEIGSFNCLISPGFPTIFTFVYEACQAVEPIQNGFGDELNGFGDTLLNLASPGGFVFLCQQLL